ncbi:MAG: energy transducer TonB [Chthoniobacterales bacterium]
MTSREKLTAYDRAIAPYVAKARATYPAAKKRFLAGLPSGYRFWVRVWLSEDGEGETSEINVEKISSGKISGTIESQLTVVSRYKKGQRITVLESQIQNWQIVPPGGPNVISAPKPLYSFEARSHHVQGKGWFAMHIRPDGTVRRVEIIKSTGHRILDDAALAALRQWRFRPEAFERTVRTPIMFALEGQPHR